MLASVEFNDDHCGGDTWVSVDFPHPVSVRTSAVSSCLRLLRLTTCDGGCGHDDDQVDKLTHYVIALCGVHYYASIDK